MKADVRKASAIASLQRRHCRSYLPAPRWPVSISGSFQAIPPLVIGVPEVVALVAELRLVAEHQEAMGKAPENQKLIFVLRGQLHAVPLAIGGRAGAQIHRHVKGTDSGHPHQLGLGVVLLKR